MQQTLYKRNSDGKILSWGIAVVQSGMSWDIVSSDGLLSGKQKSKTTTISKGKNIGKSNETSPKEQALSDAQSKIDKKLKDGYKEVVIENLNSTSVVELEKYINEVLPQDNTDDSGNIIPMKCQPYYREIKIKGSDKVELVPKIKFPCIVQAKINGARSFVSYSNKESDKDLFGKGTVSFFSKRGEDYTVLDHIGRDFLTIFEDLKEIIEKEILVEYNLKIEDLIFDGELYTVKANFLGQVISAVRGKKGVGNELTPYLRYFAFDLAIPNLPQKERLVILNKILKLYYGNVTANIVESRFTRGTGVTNIIQVRNNTASNHEEVLDLCKSAIDSKFEGVVCRSYSDEYGFGKRPAYITKLKMIKDEDFVVIDIRATEKDEYIDSKGVKHKVAMLLCENLEGEEFMVTPEYSKEERARILVNKNKLLGSIVKVEFYEYTERGVPLHAKATFYDSI